jgi:hypothetical protein
MSYVTVSTWALGPHTDEAAMIAEGERNVAAIRKLGAERAYMARTSATEGVFVVVYPDEATWAKASEQVAHMRTSAAGKAGVQLKGVMGGAAIVTL